MEKKTNLAIKSLKLINRVKGLSNMAMLATLCVNGSHLPLALGKRNTSYDSEFLRS